jgi:regulator of extracellular matrix RemA (YlzA/DUF370 family)
LACEDPENIFSNDTNAAVLSQLSNFYAHSAWRFKMKLINIGFGNMVSASRLVAIVSPESAPVKRIMQDARKRGSLIDATYGRRTRAVIITDSDHVILSAVQPETVANRLSERVEEDEEDDGIDDNA